MTSQKSLFQPELFLEESRTWEQGAGIRDRKPLTLFMPSSAIIALQTVSKVLLEASGRSPDEAKCRATLTRPVPSDLGKGRECQSAATRLPESDPHRDTAAKAVV